MMAKLLFPIACLALAACQAAERDAPEPTEAAAVTDPAPAPAPTAIALPASLAGEYRVADVAGQAVDLPYGITASITSDRIHLTADCVNVEWGYAMDADGSLSTLRVPTEGCARGLNPIEEALVEAFDGLEQVSRNSANGYEFSGRGPTATLFTQ